jgi:DNA sulfur modification protein DndB
MLENVSLVDSLQAQLARACQADFFENVKPQLVAEYIANGWTIYKKNKGSIRVRRPKPLHLLVEDRVWALLYRMGFEIMSGRGGAKLTKTTLKKQSVREQIDVLAADDDVAIFAECKSAQSPRRATNVAEQSGQLASYRGDIVTNLNSMFVSETKRKGVPILWFWNIQPSANDQARATADGVRILERSDLEYYEQLVRQIGPASKFQFLADLLPGVDISGLRLVVPAIKTRMGGSRCYAFAIKPSNLLRIAYVSHRSKGKATDIDTYQRLIKKSRLKDIRRFISSGGVFPTNIVLSLDHKRRIRFDKAETPRGHEHVVDGEFGWLYLPCQYKSAWVIDGQHRLFAYAGHNLADKAEVTVLAFDDLSPSQQASMFVSINAEQKSVKRNLLVELWAELHWDSTDPMEQAKAVRSKTALALDEDVDSPLFRRILRSDDVPSDVRCITLQTVTSALKYPEFFLSVAKNVQSPGAFWTASMDKTLMRARVILNAWFSKVRMGNENIWDVGKGDGGAIAMNNGITIQLNVLRSVLRFYFDQGAPLHALTEQQLMDKLGPFAHVLGRHFSTMSSAQILQFRRLQGVAGQTTGTRECQAAMTAALPDYRPEGLDHFMLLRDSKTSEEAQSIITRVQRQLHRYLMDDLKAEYGDSEQGWWSKGIPKEMRVRIDAARNLDEALEPRESKFYLIEYRDIILHNWERLGVVFGNRNRTTWLVHLNEIRNVAFHPEKGFVSLEDLQFLRAVDQWFADRLGGRDSGGATIESIQESSDAAEG